MADEPENETSQEDADKEDLYMEPKPKPKLVRVLTVLAYILSVSMAAILLSVYYVFMWDGQPTLARRTDPSMQHRIGIRDYDYSDTYSKNVDDIARASYETTELLAKTNLVSIENLITENFTNNPNTNYGIPEGLPADNRNELNVTKSELEVLDIYDKNVESPTEIYDTYSASSIATSTEDTINGINDDMEDPSNINELENRNNLFYRKYLYNKLVIP